MRPGHPHDMLVTDALTRWRAAFPGAICLTLSYTLHLPVLLLLLLLRLFGLDLGVGGGRLRQVRALVAVERLNAVVDDDDALGLRRAGAAPRSASSWDAASPSPHTSLREALTRFWS